MIPGMGGWDALSSGEGIAGIGGRRCWPVAIMVKSFGWFGGPNRMAVTAIIRSRPRAGSACPAQPALHQFDGLT
jgi:hypothetical protein